MDLRDYQSEAIAKTWSILVKDKEAKPVIVAPTGSGKSLLIAALAAKTKKKVIILQHRKELIQQNYEKLIKLGVTDIGIFSAALGKKQINKRVIVAGIQSIYKHWDKFRDEYLIITDECHLISDEDESMFLTFLNNIKHRIVGLTATPFRTKTGSIIGQMFNQISYEIPMSTLIKAGYLVPLTSKASFDLTPDTSNVKVTAGEYVMREIEMLYDETALNKEILKDIRTRARGRESILVFCSGVQHAEKLFKMLDEPAVIVTGDSLFRDRDLALFKERKVRWLVSVDVLTTGFDAPNIDCIVLLRPTKSAGLYVQMLGRGMRPYQNKNNCLVLDYAGNLERFGAVDQIGIRRVVKNVGEEEVDELVTGRLYTKFCPSCGEMCGMFLKNCPSCSFTFAMETMGIRASESSVMGGDEEEVIFDVLETTFSRHKKAGKPDSFRIDYNIGTAEKISEYLLFEHNAWGRKKAQARWRKQCFEEFGLDEPPETVGDAFGRATMGELKGVSKIKAKKENGFWRVLAWKWDENQTLESPDLFVPMSEEDELLVPF